MGEGSGIETRNGDYLTLPCRVTLALATGRAITGETHHHAIPTHPLQLRGMPRQPPPECAAHHAPRTAARRNRRPRWMAHPSQIMSDKIIRISSRAIQCRADAEGATEYAIRYGGRDFIVTAHSRMEADIAVEYYRAPEADESQPDLIK